MSIRNRSIQREERWRIAVSILVSSIALYAPVAFAQSDADLQRDITEQRRAQEREIALRQSQERVTDVRLPVAGATATGRLPATEQPCFTIRQVLLTGEASSGFQWLLTSLAGPNGDDAPQGRCIGAQGIGLLIARGQDALVARGFVTSRLLASPQDLSGGSLVLTFLPGRVNAVLLQPTQPGADGPNVHIGPAVPIRSGDILNLRDIEQALENFKRVPGADVDMQIAPADQPDHSDLLVSYTAAFPFRLSLSLDDSGSKATGRYQGSATLSLDNPLRLSDLFYVTLSHDLGGGDDGARGTHGNVAHYSVPVGYWTLGATASSSRYFQKVAGLTQSYTYSGTSDNAELKVSRMVYRDAVRKTSASVKAWQRKSNNYVDDTEVEIQRRVVGGWELGVNHKDIVGTVALSATLNYRRGTGNFDTIAAPEESSGTGTSRFGVVNLDLNASVPFKFAKQSLHYTAALRVQDNTTSLTPQDRFAIGGRYTVRGFDGESSLSAERGWTLRNDIGVDLAGGAIQVYLGIDAGEVGGPASQSLVGNSLTGAVLGLRGSFQKLQYDFFIGTPLSKPDGFTTANTTAGFTLNLNF